MRKKFAAFATAGLVALVAGPALPAPGGKNSEIDALKEAVTALEGRVDTLEGEVDANTTDIGTLQGDVSTNTTNFGLLDQTVSDLVISLTGIEDQLELLGGRLDTVEEDIISSLFDIVVRSSTYTADPGGVFIDQDCEVGEMALGGFVSDPDSGDRRFVDAQGFNWPVDGNWASGWAASVTDGTGEDVQISAVCATALMEPGFGVNPLTNN
jgi:hypothetical protein